MRNRLELGTWNVICDRCGLKKKAYELSKEWTGLMVCTDTCYEPRHPQDFLRLRPDTGNTPWSRPEPTDVYIELVNRVLTSEFPNGFVSGMVLSGPVSNGGPVGPYSGSTRFTATGATTICRISPTSGYVAGIASGTTVTFSVIVKMDDGLAPVFGASTGSSNTDFHFRVAGVSASVMSSYITDDLGGGFYRVSVTRVTSSVDGAYGVDKSSSTGTRSFVVTGWQIEINSAATAYQKTLNGRLVYDYP